MLTPSMPRVAIDRLEELFINCESYLEYGCGGSTTVAAKLGVKNIIYCDSSSDWIDSVSAIVSPYPDIKSYPIYVDIGEVGGWGRPKDRSKAFLWKNYCYQPWDIAKKNNIEPQLILIDGRFRVACFMVSLLSARAGTQILFDDFCDREYYQVVKNIIAPRCTYDRLAEFIVPEQFDRSASLLMLLDYINETN